MKLKLMNSLFNLILKRMPFYSVARGRRTGVYLTWPECEAQVTGFTSPIFRKFSSYDEAANFVIIKGGTLDNKIDPVSSSNDNTRKNKSQRNLVHTDDFPTDVTSTSAHIPTLQKYLIDLPKKSESASSSNQGKKRSNDDITVANKKLKKDVNEIPLKKLKKYGELSFSEDGDGYVHVYTDGSCEGNGKKNAVAGLGVYFGEGHALNTAKPVSGRATNNCGEIQAATLAIKLAADCGIQKLCINTDSRFVINAVTKWMSGWKRNGWCVKSGNPVKNITDFKNYEEMTSKHRIIIKWNYVKAHCGIIGNERADALAKQGGEMFRAGLRS